MRAAAVLHVWPGWAAEERSGAQFKDEEALLMHESGAQGPSLKRSGPLHDVKPTDLCYGYQSELTFTMSGVSQRGLQHTHTHSHSHRHAHTHTHTHSHTHSLTHTHTLTFVFWFTGTLHRRNGFYTVQTVCAIALHLPYT